MHRDEVLHHEAVVPGVQLPVDHLAPRYPAAQINSPVTSAENFKSQRSLHATWWRGKYRRHIGNHDHWNFIFWGLDYLIYSDGSTYRQLVLRCILISNLLCKDIAVLSNIATFHCVKIPTSTTEKFRKCRSLYRHSLPPPLAPGPFPPRSIMLIASPDPARVNKTAITQWQTFIQILSGSIKLRHHFAVTVPTFYCSCFSSGKPISAYGLFYLAKKAVLSGHQNKASLNTKLSCLPCSIEAVY